jgi:hypothetical protein
MSKHGTDRACWLRAAIRLSYWAAKSLSRVGLDAAVLGEQNGVEMAGNVAGQHDGLASMVSTLLCSVECSALATAMRASGKGARARINSTRISMYCGEISTLK